MQAQLVDALERLQQLHTSGFLTDAELAQAKAKLLGVPAPEAVTVEEADAMLERVDRAERKANRLEHEAALRQLDEHWEAEKKHYQTRTQYGTYVTPTESDAGLKIVGAVVIGLLLLGCIAGISTELVPFFIPIAVILSGITIYSVRREAARTEAYQAAYQRYLSDRQDLEGERKPPSGR